MSRSSMRVASDKLMVPLRMIENRLVFLVLLSIAAIPALEIAARRLFRTGIHGSSEYVQHLIVWLTFMGGMIASRDSKHLALAAGIDRIAEKHRRWIAFVNSLVCIAVTSSFAWFSFEFIRNGFDPSHRIGVLPFMAVMAIVPIGFAVMALRFALQAPGGMAGRLASLAGVGIAVAIVTAGDKLTGAPLLPVYALLIASGLLGAPLFVVLGGLAMLFILHAGGMPAVLPNEAYTMLIGPSIPSLPLFTLAGFILSESKAGERLVRLFRALLGWLPGGLAIMATVVCAFFTTFTGASGVTILALGGILSFALLKEGYSRPFSIGLLTASGSLGLLFPPSLPIILYGVVAHIDIRRMFVAGIIPGVVLVAAVSLFGVIKAVRSRGERVAFSAPELGRALRDSAWEVALPVLVLAGFFSGFATLVECGAIAVIYALIVETAVHRDIALRRVPGVFGKCVPIIGGVLVILAVANGLSYYIVDAEIPVKLAAWCKASIQSKYVFLLLLNCALLVVGCLMDIFSAIMVVAPLVIPLGEAFGIDPVHLGIIFLANLELGYLTPPVGINLFLSSYRFEEPLTKVYRTVLPFLAILLGAVLLITYVPWLTTALLSVVKF